MANIRKKTSGRFEAQVRIKGFAQSKTFRTRSEAMKWAYQLEDDLHMDHEGHVRGKTLFQALDRYVQDVTPKKRGWKAERNRILRIQKEGFAHLMLDDLNSMHIQHYIDSEMERGLKGSSVNRDLSLLSAVFTTCRKRWKWMTHNPMDGLDKPKEPAARDRRISDEEIAAILDKCGYIEGQTSVVTSREMLAVGFLLAIETGMRIGEIWGLEWEHVYLDRQYVFLPMTKNGSSREVPLSKKAVELLRSMHNDTRRVFKTKKAAAGSLFRTVTQEAEIKDIVFHDTRHEAITRFVLKGKISAPILAEFIGHKNLNELMTYYNAKATDVAKLLD